MDAFLANLWSKIFCGSFIILRATQKKRVKHATICDLDILYNKFTGKK